LTFRRQEQSSKKSKEELNMVDDVQEARDEPVVSKVDIFDSLLTISFLTKALAEEVMLLEGDAKKGGEKDGSKGTFDLGSK